MWNFSVALPACKPPHPDSVPHRRSIVVAAADRSPRFADGSLIRSRSNKAVAAYLSAYAPPAVVTIGGRRRTVTRRRQRPRSKATQCTKCTASYTHSGHCAALLSSLSPSVPRGAACRPSGRRRLFRRFTLDHNCSSTMFSHRAVSSARWRSAARRICRPWLPPTACSCACQLRAFKS